MVRGQAETTQGCAISREYFACDQPLGGCEVIPVQISSGYGVVPASQSSAVHYGRSASSEKNSARPNPKNLAFMNEADRKTERNRQRP